MITNESVYLKNTIKLIINTLLINKFGSSFKDQEVI